MSAARIAQGLPPLERPPRNRLPFVAVDGLPPKFRSLSDVGLPLLPPDPIAAAVGDFDAKDEHLASKSLLSIAMFYLGDVSVEDRDKNVRAILMRFIGRKTK